MKKICMFVYNECTHDARVLKEAKTLTMAGFQVKIIALEKNNLPKHEERDGFTIQRVGRGTRVSIYFLDFANQIFQRLLSKKNKIYLTKQKAEDSAQNPIVPVLLKILFIPLYILSRLVIITYKLWRKFVALAFSLAPFLNFVTGFYWSAYKAAREDPADIYHAHDLNTLPAGWMAKKKLGGKLIYDSHELYVERNTLKKPSKFSKKMTSLMENFLLKSVDQTITVNQSIAEELKSRYGINLPAIVMNTPAYNVIERPKSLRLVLNIPAGKRIIIYSGSITFNRGLEELIRSTRYLKDYVLVLMGYGKESYLEELKEVAIEADVDDKLYFFGPVPHEEVPIYVASADVGAAPIKNVALSYYLCSPNKLFEFIQAGLPVVGSNFPELTRVITDYKIGYTFDPANPKDIAAKIEKIFENPENYHQMKHNAHEAAKVFNWELESEKLLKVYNFDN